MILSAYFSDRFRSRAAFAVVNAVIAMAGFAMFLGEFSGERKSAYLSERGFRFPFTCGVLWISLPIGDRDLCNGSHLVHLDCEQLRASLSQGN